MVELPIVVAYGGFLYLKHLWDTWRTHRFGIYGIWGTGKTTLSRQLSTSGELEDFGTGQDTSTEHPFNPDTGRYMPPPATRKRVAMKNTQTLKVQSKTLISTDLGGQMKYFDLWLEDMVSRDVECIIWVIDHRHLIDQNDQTQQVSFKRFVDTLLTGDYAFSEKSLQKKAKKYKPLVVGLVANKADLWLDDMWEKHWKTARMNEHPIFQPFVQDLARLQAHQIPTLKRPISALRNWSCEETIWDIMQAKI